MLVDYMPLTYSPSMLTEVSTQPNGVLRIHGVLQRANVKNQNGRIYPKRLLMREAVKFGEMIRERRAIGELDHPECVTGCDIMTYEGWKDIKDISDNERIYTLNIETGNMELQTITKRIAEHYTGTMYHIKGKNIDIDVTPAHRFVVTNAYNKKKSFITAEDMFLAQVEGRGTHQYIPKTCNPFVGIDTSTIKISGVNPPIRHSKYWKDEYANELEINSEVWFSFLGLYLAEGFVDGNNIFIAQNEGDKANFIRDLLKQLPLVTIEKEINNRKNKAIVFKITDNRLATALRPLGKKYTKYIPVEYKQYSAKYLQKLIDWYHIGDGRTITYNGYVNKSIFTVSLQLANDLHELLIKTGISSSMVVQTSKKAYIFAGHEILPENKKPLHVMKFGKSENIHLDWRFLTIEPHKYDGKIYCVQVPNQTFYCRNEGKAFWSGNSPVVNLRNVSHNITEVKFEGDDLVGTIEILSTPAGNIVKELMRNGIRLGVSSRGMGSVREIDENTVEVQDDFQLICFDIVSNPSTQGAFLTENNAQAPDAYNNLNNLIYEFFSELK